jgi:hypothetical protein
METKSETKSKRGGKRPGAGRPVGSTSRSGGDRASLGVEIALAGLDHALKVYDVGSPPEEHWTPIQKRWHLAMVLFGVPVDTLAAALFKPQISKNFSRDIAAAIEAVEADRD